MSRLKIEPIIQNTENLHNLTGQLIRKQPVNKEEFPERHGYWVRLLQCEVELRTMRNGMQVGEERNRIIGGYKHTVDLVYDTSIGALRIEPSIAPVCKSCDAMYLGRGSVANTTGVACGECGTQLKIEEDGNTTYDWSPKTDKISGDVRRLVQRDLAAIIDESKKIRWSTTLDEQTGVLKRAFVSGLNLSANGDQRDKQFISRDLIQLNEWLNKVADEGKFRQIPAGTGMDAIMNPLKPDYLKNVHMAALKRAPGKETGEITSVAPIAENTTDQKERD